MFLTTNGLAILNALGIKLKDFDTGERTANQPAILINLKHKLSVSDHECLRSIATSLGWSSISFPGPSQIVLINSTNVVKKS
jgi:hypothetical protein